MGARNCVLQLCASSRHGLQMRVPCQHYLTLCSLVLAAYSSNSASEIVHCLCSQGWDLFLNHTEGIEPDMIVFSRAWWDIARHATCQNLPELRDLHSTSLPAADGLVPGYDMLQCGYRLVTQEPDVLEDRDDVPHDVLEGLMVNTTAVMALIEVCDLGASWLAHTSAYLMNVLQKEEPPAWFKLSLHSMLQEHNFLLACQTTTMHVSVEIPRVLLGRELSHVLVKSLH